VAIQTNTTAQKRHLGPASVPTSSLRPNPHNPRMLFDKVPLKTLEESIKKVGVLVPLTVYMADGSDQYTILDGQRRWICARNLGLPEVPINEVAEPSVAQNIVTMLFLLSAERVYGRYLELYRERIFQHHIPDS
jgi:ParB/RepB/Spo0J family partition protein